MSLSFILYLIYTVLIVTHSRSCSEQYEDCLEIEDCVTAMSTLSQCVESAENDASWRCSIACKQATATYFRNAAPDWIPDETLESCECDDTYNDTSSCEHGTDILRDAGCGNQFIFPSSQNCVITRAKSDTIHVSSLGSDNMTTCGAVNCPCGTIGFAFFLATNEITFDDGSYNHYFNSTSIIIHIDGINPSDLSGKSNWKKCGMYVDYRDSEDDGMIDPIFGVGSLDNKANITFNFGYVRSYLGHKLRVRTRNDWYPCAHPYCSPKDNEAYAYCDGVWWDVFRKPYYNENEIEFNELHQISIYIEDLIWEDIFRHKYRAALVQFSGDPRITTYLINAVIDNIYIDTSQKGLIAGQNVEIIDSVFQNIVIYNEAIANDVIFDDIAADQYLFGDWFWETRTPQIKWVKGYKFIRTQFDHITQYDENKRFIAYSDATAEHMQMKSVFEDIMNVTTQDIDVDLAIIYLPAATFSAWMEFKFIDCIFDTISNVDLMRSDPGVIMTAPWNITNTMFIDVYDCSIMIALSRTKTYFEDIYIETTTMRDVTQIEEALLIFDGQTTNTLKNITYNYVFPIKDGSTALNTDILDVTRSILECLNKPNQVSYSLIGQQINRALCNIPKYPIPLLVNEGDVTITDLNTIIDWDKQQFIDMVQIQDFKTYNNYFRKAMRNLVDLDVYPCFRERTNNCTFYPILYDYYDFEWFVGANFDVALILNAAGASLNIDNWYTDRQIHNTLIYNTGDAVLNNVSTNYYHQYITDNSSAIHDPNDLHGDFCFFHAIGTFHITNSKIYGCGTWTFGILESEYFIVDNVEVRWSAIVLSSTNLARNTQLTNSHFIDVGLFYASLYYLETAFALVQTPPFAIAGASTYFKQCLFSFYDPIGFIHAPYSLFNRDYNLETAEATEIIIESSEFIVAMISTNIVYDPQDIAAAFNFTDVFHNDALILLDDNTELTFINNIFAGNPLDETVPLLQINNSLYTNDGRHFTNCMIDNHLTNYALRIIGGKMLPCHLEQIVNLISNQYYGECLPTLGALDPVYGNSTRSYFTKSAHYSGSLVVIDRDESSVYAAFGLASGNITIKGDPSDNWQPIKVHDGWLIISETNYPETAVLSYDENKCDLFCYKYANAWNDIMQFIAACDASLEEEASITTLAEFASQQSQAAFSFAHVVELDLASNQIYPGGKFQLNGLYIKDAYDQDALDYILPITTNLFITNSKTSANLDVDIQWSIYHDITYCNVTNRGCYYCSECGDIGLFVQSFTVKDLNIADHFDVVVTLVNDSTSLFASSFSLQLAQCPPGLGVNQKTFQCEECEETTFSFYETTNNCTTCSGLEGVTCPGQNEVRIKVDYWFQYQNDSLLTSDCPTGYCCQHSDGCTYSGDNNDTGLCAVGRDPTSPMCGKCIEGLSEYMGSVDCGPCNKTAAAQYNIFVFIITSLFCWYTVYYSRYQKDFVQQLIVIQNQQRKTHTAGANGSKHKYHFSTFGGYFWDKFRMLRVQLYKPLMYYFQSLTFILQQGGITVYLAPLLNMFNLSIDVMNSNNSGRVNATGFCLYHGIQARGEIAVGFMVPAFLLFELGVCSIFFRRRQCCNKEPAVGIAFWAILLMCMGVIFNTVLKALACRKIGASYHLFYAGAELCFDWGWFLHLVFLVLVVMVFAVLFFRLRRYDVARRQHPNFSMRTFILPYKSKYWYWEFVLLSRRFMVAFIALFPYSSKQYLNMFLLLLFTIYMALHIWLRPFYHPENNYVEAICLFCTICVIAFIGFLDDDDAGVKASFVTLFILIPLMLFAYYIATICCYKYNQQNNMQNMPDRSDTNVVELMTAQGLNTVASASKSIVAANETTLKDGDKVNDDAGDHEMDNNATIDVAVEVNENNDDETTQ